ncbi:cysteine desulfurase family protein [Candidatus Chlamydia sanziniae]|uniref:Cysteine desulfurase n=1 Tax=Candidatus Chlamydia sanziniae TaxID=1806891 RepID=A0A1A9HVV8_9CHLA|nr:cysteine desulfurase family protein [Candidatus Chlamydia sanziniae]ANH79128.1 Cysteine desulfurase [Candidatus Chlamydia sanziniae]
MIYLDNNAMAFPERGLLEFLFKLFGQENLYANPSSIHSFGKRSSQLILETTTWIQQVLSFRGRVLYTSGATESLNLAIANLSQGSHVITSSMEHPAIIEPLKQARLSVSYLDPEEGECCLNCEQIEEVLKPETSAIVLGWVNSELGSKTDIASIAQLAQKHQLQFIVDATAIIGKERIVLPPGVTIAAFSGHKFHALPGIGVLLIDPRTKLSPIFFGGGQQQGLRSGTENLWGIASLLYVFRYLDSHQEEITQQILSYRNAFEIGLKTRIPNIVIHCEEKPRVNNVSAIAFPPLEGEVVQIALDREGIACSYGSACFSGATAPLKSLVGMNIPEELVASTVRFSFSHLLSLKAINEIIPVIEKVISHLRSPW